MDKIKPTTELFPNAYNYKTNNIGFQNRFDQDINSNIDNNNNYKNNNYTNYNINNNFNNQNNNSNKNYTNYNHNNQNNIFNDNYNNPNNIDNNNYFNNNFNNQNNIFNNNINCNNQNYISNNNNYNNINNNILNNNNYNNNNFNNLNNNNNILNNNNNYNNNNFNNLNNNNNILNNNNYNKNFQLGNNANNFYNNNNNFMNNFINYSSNNNQNNNIKYNIKTPEATLFNLKLLDNQYINPYQRMYIISKELNQLNKINLKKNPYLFVTKQEMEMDILRNKENSQYFLISILQDLLEKSGVRTVVERKCEQPELASDLLQMIVSGIGLLPVYEFHTNYSESENFKILTDENVQKNFIENWKNKISSCLNIEKKEIFITDIRKGSVKFNAFLGKELTMEEMIRLKNQYSNEFINEGIKYGELLLQSCKLSVEMFDPQYNNYNNWAPKGENRGGEPYDSPLTWRGFGLKVLGKYDNGNNTWIGMKNVPGEFPVAYHGIGCKSNNPLELAGNVMNQGFIVGRRQAYANSADIRHPGRNCGYGAYFTPNIIEAGAYAGIGNFKGKNYKIVFMCRVRKESIREPYRGNQPKYWILDGSKNEVRPYRILIKEHNLNNI